LYVLENSSMVLMWYAQLACSCENAVEDIEEGWKFDEKSSVHMLANLASKLKVHVIFLSRRYIVIGSL